MGIDNPIHLLFIAAVALLVLGPKRLPEVARSLGKGIREFRDAMSDGSYGGFMHMHEDSPPVSASSPPPEAEVVPDGGSVSAAGSGPPAGEGAVHGVGLQGTPGGDAVHDAGLKATADGGPTHGAVTDATDPIE